MMPFLFRQPLKWKEIIIQFREAWPMEFGKLVCREKVGRYFEGFNGVKTIYTSLLEWMSRNWFV